MKAIARINLDYFYMDVYVTDAKGNHKLGTITRDKDFRSGETKVKFNWSAWGEQDVETTMQVARAFQEAAVVAALLDGGSITVEQLANQYTVEAFNAGMDTKSPLA